MGKISKEKAARLWDELAEYEKHTEMTDVERAALHEWVSDGYSVHENSSLAYNESGCPADFLDVYRYEEEIRLDLEKLSPGEKENYLARLRGEDTVDTLREDLYQLLFKARMYAHVLRIHGLLGEAEQKIKEARERSRKEAKAFDEWIVAHPEEELPFSN